SHPLATIDYRIYPGRIQAMVDVSCRLSPTSTAQCPDQTGRRYTTQAGDALSLPSDIHLLFSGGPYTARGQRKLRNQPRVSPEEGHRYARDRDYRTARGDSGFRRWNL